MKIKTFWLIIWETERFSLPLIVKGDDLNNTKDKLFLAVPDSQVTQIMKYWSEDIDEAWLKIETIKEADAERWKAKQEWWNKHIGDPT